MPMKLHITPQERNENNREYAYRLLRSNIMTLQLLPGTVINEDEISEKLCMSRTPVHEAVTKLKEEWLVEVIPQRGTKVTLIDSMLMKEGYRMRCILDAAILRENAGKLDNTHLQKLLSIVKFQEEASHNTLEQIDTFIRADDEFHRQIYIFCGCPHMWDATRGLVSHYDRARYLDALSGTTCYETVLKQHRELCDYMYMGLPNDINAEKKINEHLTSFRDNIMSTIEKYNTYFAL